MVQAVSSQSSSLQTQQLQQTQQTAETRQVERKEQESKAEDRPEPVEESTKVSLGQQGPSGSVAPSRSPTQMYASVAGMM